ncbi:MAG TPA: hypothetical protein VH309_08580 [Elusimicrobiota bacterium]|nr:hypothetical protein [Elusimicrobiota bacterium]
MIAPALAVHLALARVDALVAREQGLSADAVAALDRRAEAQFKTIAPLGWRAAAPLGAAANDPKRRPKLRLFATTFLGEIADPAVFEPLSRVLLDGDQDPDVRLAAAQGLLSLDVPPASARRTDCAAAAQEDLPRPVLDETLIALTRLGCDDPAPLERAARLFGPRPDECDLATVRRALEALSRSRGDAPLLRLLALAAYFPSRSAARAAAFSALDARRGDLVTALAPRAFPVVRDALRAETSVPATMLVLVRLADAFGPEADEALLPLASHPDAEVLANAAEALARRKAAAALPDLEAVLAGAMTDPRFAPLPGRPDPSLLLARIQAATESLRRARAAQT